MYSEQITIKSGNITNKNELPCECYFTRDIACKIVECIADIAKM